MSETVLVTGEGEGRKGGSDRSGSRRSGFGLDSERVWSLLGWVGFVLAAVGLVDIALTWYPFDFGNVEWEFGTVTQSLNALPTVTLGLGLWLVSALVAERIWLSRTVAVALVLLAVVVVAIAVLFVTTAPIALNSVPQNAIATGLKKSIARTATQSVLYPVVFLVIGIKGWKASRDGRSR